MKHSWVLRVRALKSRRGCHYPPDAQLLPETDLDPEHHHARRVQLRAVIRLQTSGFFSLFCTFIFILMGDWRLHNFWCSINDMSRIRLPWRSTALRHELLVVALVPGEPPGSPRSNYSDGRAYQPGVRRLALAHEDALDPPCIHARQRRH